MLCAISGVAPQVPVASRKSGNIFEKHLIEHYISENGTDPVTNEELTVDDLVELKSARAVVPRPPTLTSIPSLLSTFQNEWDAIVLEAFKLRQSLAQTRQELSTALYEHDAAVRVIARLSQERDQAREALSRITLNGSGTTNGEAMQVDEQRLPEALLAKVVSTQKKLLSTRKKRAVPDDWATGDSIRAFKPVEESEALYPGAKSLSLDSSGDLVLTGSDSSIAGVFSVSKNSPVQELQSGPGTTTGAIWAGPRAVVSTSRGTVKVFDNGSEIANFSGHAGEVAALAVHPSGDILASVGSDKSYILYDLTTLTQAIHIYTDSALTCCRFHPDGELFAAGASDGHVKIFSVSSGTQAANLDECGASGPIQAITFSENGYWLAVVAQGSTYASVWDLRKETKIKVLDIGSQIDSIAWDYTGQFLALAGPGGLAVQQYAKSTKEWLEPFRSAAPTVAVEWGERAQSLTTVDREGRITIVGSG